MLNTIQECDKHIAEIHDLMSKTKTYKTQQRLQEKLDESLDRRLELKPRVEVSIYSNMKYTTA